MSCVTYNGLNDLNLLSTPDEVEAVLNRIVVDPFKQSKRFKVEINQDSDFSKGLCLPIAIRWIWYRSRTNSHRITNWCLRMSSERRRICALKKKLGGITVDQDKPALHVALAAKEFGVLFCEKFVVNAMHTRWPAPGAGEATLEPGVAGVHDRVRTVVVRIDGPARPCAFVCCELDGRSARRDHHRAVAPRFTPERMLDRFSFGVVGRRRGNQQLISGVAIDATYVYWTSSAGIRRLTK